MGLTISNKVRAAFAAYTELSPADQDGFRWLMQGYDIRVQQDDSSKKTPEKGKTAGTNG